MSRTPKVGMYAKLRGPVHPNWRDQWGVVENINELPTGQVLVCVRMAKVTIEVPRDALDFKQSIGPADCAF